jgi:aldehyde dehydrogenase (NAD+)
MDRRACRDAIERHREFFASGKTRDQAFRAKQLRLLRKAVLENESGIFDALRLDLGRPAFEAYGGDVAIVINEIDFALKRLNRWMKPKKARTPLVYFPGKSFTVPEPYGVALIIGPWNFPFQLMFAPLVGAIAAGNCVLLKPSITSPRTSHLLTKIIRRYFDPAYLSVAEGGAETAQLLLAERFDHIFFTGGPATGRHVMAAAARHLTPVTLELGGKNPCIVEADTHLDHTARRIAWGKFFNAGQSCVAVDYLLVRKKIKQPLLDRIARSVADFYGDDPSRSPDFGRIVDETHFDRISALLEQGRIICGGQADRASRYVAPTIIDGIRGDEPIMREEIFGPLLPVIEYDDVSEAVAFVNARPKPLALYFFSRNRVLQERVLRETASGGGCINDVVIHETTRLPFGGVGESGIGKYHGRAGFETFSHERSIMKSGFLFDNVLRYPPYRDHLKWLRKVF